MPISYDNVSYDLLSVIGPKAEDKSQGELKGMLKEIGYTADQVYKF